MMTKYYTLLSYGTQRYIILLYSKINIFINDGDSNHYNTHAGMRSSAEKKNCKWLFVYPHFQYINILLNI